MKYKNPSTLPKGAVLVVGTGQSGAQIAQELYQSGRKVYLSIGSAGRVPRRYRGKDISDWFTRIGIFDTKVEELKSAADKFHPHPQISGQNGGQGLNLHSSPATVSSCSGTCAMLTRDNSSSHLT
jgi:putative flavoprotein involved in K+ transport